MLRLLLCRRIPRDWVRTAFCRREEGRCERWISVKPCEWLNANVRSADGVVTGRWTHAPTLDDSGPSVKGGLSSGRIKNMLR